MQTSQDNSSEKTPLRTQSDVARSPESNAGGAARRRSVSNNSVDGGRLEDQSPRSTRSVSMDPERTQSSETKLIEVHFGAGPLGVTLRRRADDGVVFIFDIVPDSQAVGLDVRPGDELWGVGATEIGGEPLDKEAWNGLIQYIKSSARPLKMVWMRYPPEILEAMNDTRAELAATSSSPPDDNNAKSITGKNNTARGADSPASPPPVPVNTPVSVASNISSRTNSSSASTSSSESSPPPHPHTPPPKVSAAVPEHTDEYFALQHLLDKISFKDAKQSNRGSSTDKYRGLLKDGRVILKSGPLSLLIAAGFIKKAQKLTRHVVLLTDLLLILIPAPSGPPGESFQLEQIVELRVCKLNSSGQVFGGDSGHPDTSFEITCPSGKIELAADAQETKEVWVLNIYLAICDTIDESQKVLGWRHQYMLGTMHSAVLLRDEARIKELVAKCECGDLEFSIVDAQDQDGYTPLHYACMLRLKSIVKLLHEATANVSIPDHQGLTPLHWSAMQLDDFSLELLCSHVFDVDLCDNRNRTPLYMAVVEGRDHDGKSNQQALKKCLTVLLAHQPKANIVDAGGNSLLHYLASSWQHECIERLVEAGCDIHGVRAGGATALHSAAAALPLKVAVGEGNLDRIVKRGRLDGASGDSMDEEPWNQKPESLVRMGGAATLRELLKAGAKPNQRDAMGRTALHIMLGDPECEARWGPQEIIDGVSVLLSFGARIPDDSTLVQESIKVRHPDIPVTALVEKWTCMPPLSAEELQVSFNEYQPTTEEEEEAPFVVTPPSVRGGGDGGLQTVNKLGDSSSGSSKPRRNSATLTAAAAAASSTSASGSDSPRCVLCAAQFSLFKRQHHCRLCCALCCDDCSRKRVVLDGAQVRTCDSCFNRLIRKQEKVNRQAILNNIKPQAAFSRSSIEDNNNNNKKALFGGASQGGPESEKEAKKQGRDTSMAATMSTLSEAHERLQERGEKLSRLQDRTADMANNADAFAKLAKQLNEQNKSSWF